MMRPVLLATALCLMAVPTVSAQGDGCTQSQPCPWVTDVEADGFVSYVEPYNGSLGDWIVVEGFNYDDDESHTLSLDAYGRSWEVAPLADFRSDPFQLTEEGTFSLYDAPSGDDVPLRVSAGDPIEEADGDTGGPTSGQAPDRGIPGVAAPILLLGLAGAALSRRRR